MHSSARFLRHCVFLCLILFLLFAAVCSASADELPGNYDKALKYIRSNQPMEVTAEKVGWNPKQLTALREALPEGAVFHFTAKWNGISFSDEAEDLNLNKAKKDLDEKQN